MRKLLPLLPKPSHYLGAESGAIKKDPADVSARVALAFPDLYEVGMSYMGHAILYDAVNARPDLWAERVYAPTKEAAAILRVHGTPLATLESDTPLADVDVVGFSITHELCYTNVLYMLDLAGLALRAADRGEDGPLVMAGGGCVFNAEPLAPFMDCMVLGDGEDVLIEILDTVAAAKRDGAGKSALLERLAALPGVYVPAYYAPGPDGTMVPVGPGPASVEKRIVADLNEAPFPRRQPQAFDAVHDRYTIEIARGCTRGCRFCQAGMIYRPVRERTLDTLEAIITEGLDTSGYGELSFLALSAGDFSTLSGLFARSFPRCLAEQVALSLPSLRVGSVNEEIMQLIAGIRRTGATLAPEAGSQRLRDVINKGVTEEELLEHVRTLFDNGWSSVKLYFMIGLPTETDADLDAILDLCRKVATVGQGNRRLQVTAAISPFIPKPHTPFQWEAQISYETIRARVGRLLDIFRPHRRLRLKWHAAEMSWLEGIFRARRPGAGRRGGAGVPQGCAVRQLDGSSGPCAVARGPGRGGHRPGDVSRMPRHGCAPALGPPVQRRDQEIPAARAATGPGGLCQPGLPIWRVPQLRGVRWRRENLDIGGAGRLHRHPPGAQPGGARPGGLPGCRRRRSGQPGAACAHAGDAGHA